MRAFFFDAFVLGSHIGVDIKGKPLRDGGAQSILKNLERRKERTKAWQEAAITHAKILWRKNKTLTQEALATKILEKCSDSHPSIKMPSHKYLVGFISAEERAGRLCRGLSPQLKPLQ